MQRLLRLAPVALKFSQVPLGRAEIFASKGAAVPSVNQGAHEVTAASDSLHAAFPPKRCGFSSSQSVQKPARVCAFQSDRGNGPATTMLTKNVTEG